MLPLAREEWKGTKEAGALLASMALGVLMAGLVQRVSVFSPERNFSTSTGRKVMAPRSS